MDSIKKLICLVMGHEWEKEVLDVKPNGHFWWGPAWTYHIKSKLTCQRCGKVKIIDKTIIRD